MLPKARKVTESI